MIRQALFGAALVALGALGCEAEPYCLNCVPIDGSVAGSYDVRPVEVTAPNPDACMVSNNGTETCDGRDNDCNGRVDEGFDLTADARHCGRCGNRCELPFALPTCVRSLCQVRQCDLGHLDLDRNPANGCEYACTRTGTEVCDGRDNDCNGLIDEGFDLQSSAVNCGRCGNVCRFDGAEAACVAGSCRMGACAAGAIDLDRSPANGCEYRCTPSGPEVCDGRDNDCDGVADNGVDLQSDVANCGACNRACPNMNAAPTCVMGTCRVGACRPGFADLNRDVTDGCEWACGALDGTRGPEVCNGRDDDCNGLVDDGAVAGVGDACGPGMCRTGRQACESGTLRCVGAPVAMLELCNGRDDDCDGMVDEDPGGGASLPGTGPTTFCGNDVGACTYGRFACVMGRVQCVGGTGPVAEVCDGVDNDCDGAIDEGVAVPVGFRCNRRGAEGVGACAGALPRCGGTRGWTCTYGPQFRDLDDEGYCDNVDNNCDGRIDEGCLTALSRTDLRLDGGNANTIQPMIAGGGNNLGVVYLDRRTGESDIFFTRSTDGGQTWLTERRLDTNPAGTRSSVQPWLSWASGGADLIALWGDFRASGSTYRQVYASLSTDLGANWSATDVRVNAAQNDDSFNIQVAQSATSVVAVWETFFANRGRHIFAAVSTDRGGSWRPVVQLDTAPVNAVASTPDLAAVGSRVFVVWRDNRSGRPDIYFRGSLDGGLTWGARDQRLDTDAPGAHTSEEPSVAADASGNVFVAWQDVRDDRAYDIYFQRSGDGGARWLAADVRVDTDAFPRDSLHPNVMSVGNGDAAVVWQDFRLGLANPYGTRTVMGGARFPSADAPAIGGTPGRSAAVNIASANSGNAVFVAWADNRNGSLDIYANYSLDGGATYQPADLRFDTAAPGTDAHYPSVFATTVGGRPVFHAVWVDRRANGILGDVYYRALR